MHLIYTGYEKDCFYHESLTVVELSNLKYSCLNFHQKNPHWFDAQAFDNYRHHETFDNAFFLLLSEHLCPSPCDVNSASVSY